MTAQVKVAVPYKKNGVWDVKTRLEERTIPDENLNRHSTLCAWCGNKAYPKCRPYCSGGLSKDKT